MSRLIALNTYTIFLKVWKWIMTKTVLEKHRKGNEMMPTYLVDAPVVGGNTHENKIGKASITIQLAQALNPPIKVSRLVLDAMEKVPEARFSMYVKYHTHRREIGKRYPLQYDEHYKVFHAFGVQGVQQLQIGDYIQASDGCPLALQVLLQFNEEGELFNV
jgi:hypothetical protein